MSQAKYVYFVRYTLYESGNPVGAGDNVIEFSKPIRGQKDVSDLRQGIRDTACPSKNISIIIDNIVLLEHVYQSV